MTQSRWYSRTPRYRRGRYATKALIDEARRVSESIERHNEMYADDEWDRFAGVNGLTDQEVERIRDRAGV